LIIKTRRFPPSLHRELGFIGKININIKIIYYVRILSLIECLSMHTKRNSEINRQEDFREDVRFDEKMGLFTMKSPIFGVWLPSVDSK